MTGGGENFFEETSPLSRLEPNGYARTAERSANAADSDLTGNTQLPHYSYPDSRRASEVRTATTSVALAGCPTKSNPSPNKRSNQTQRKLLARRKIDGPAEVITGADRCAFELVICADAESQPGWKHPLHSSVQPTIDFGLSRFNIAIETV